MSVSVLMPVLLDSEGSREVLFLDFSTMYVYDRSGNVVSPEKNEKVVSEVASQSEASMPKIPYEDINNVVNTERKLSKDNEKHIFRRNL